MTVRPGLGSGGKRGPVGRQDGRMGAAACAQVLIKIACAHPIRKSGDKQVLSAR